MVLIYPDINTLEFTNSKSNLTSYLYVNGSKFASIKGYGYDKHGCLLARFLNTVNLERDYDILKILEKSTVNKYGVITNGKVNDCVGMNQVLTVLDYVFNSEYRYVCTHDNRPIYVFTPNTNFREIIYME